MCRYLLYKYMQAHLLCIVCGWADVFPSTSPNIKGLLIHINIISSPPVSSIPHIFERDLLEIEQFAFDVFYSMLYVMLRYVISSNLPHCYCLHCSQLPQTKQHGAKDKDKGEFLKTHIIIIIIFIIFIVITYYSNNFI